MGNDCYIYARQVGNLCSDSIFALGIFCDYFAIDYNLSKLEIKFFKLFGSNLVWVLDFCKISFLKTIEKQGLNVCR